MNVLSARRRSGQRWTRPRHNLEDREEAAPKSRKVYLSSRFEALDLGVANAMAITAKLRGRTYFDWDVQYSIDEIGYLKTLRRCYAGRDLPLPAIEGIEERESSPQHRDWHSAGPIREGTTQLLAMPKTADQADQSIKTLVSDLHRHEHHIGTLAAASKIIVNASYNDVDNGQLRQVHVLESLLRTLRKQLRRVLGKAGQKPELLDEVADLLMDCQLLVGKVSTWEKEVWVAFFHIAMYEAYGDSTWRDLRTHQLLGDLPSRLGYLKGECAKVVDEVREFRTLLR